MPIDQLTGMTAQCIIPNSYKVEAIWDLAVNDKKGQSLDYSILTNCHEITVLVLTCILLCDTTS